MRVAPFIVVRKGLPEHGETAEDRLSPCIEIGSEPVDMLQFLQQLRNTALARACTLVREAGRHGADLACGKAGRDQIADAPRTAQIGLAVATIAVLRAPGFHEARLLVVAQHAFRNPEPFGRFLDLHLDPFPRRPSTLTLVSMSRGDFKGARDVLFWCLAGTASELDLASLSASDRDRRLQGESVEER